MEDKLKAHIETTYNIKVNNISKLDEGVFKFERENDKTWVVRIFPEGRDIEHVKGDAEVLSFLNKQGFPAETLVHENIETLDGRGILVSEFIEGSPPDQNEQNLYKLGKMVGLLSSLPVADSLAQRLSGSLHHYALNGGEIKDELSIALNWMNEVESKIPVHRRAQFETLRDKLMKADGLSDLPKGLIHPDPVLKNVICTPNNDLVLIDWANAVGIWTPYFTPRNFVVCRITRKRRFFN
eukprot:TRINITY_DN6908_c0_g1_i2.p1 TRINITY_DN6908_c0_g1~~TRINITY_DN6908_c0_g1_i2.p1  ORF type:complete len:239 (-),score=40.34 TRINITY_DN6908_c0_g1_i2:247-963(-)